ncbi:MAG: reverse transcriptase domain-containing protein [Methanosarcinales archaeon]
MKTYNNLYNKLYSWNNLKLAFRKAKKGKTSKWYVKKFERDLDNELLQLKYELDSQTYYPRPLKRFIIRDPKTRVIHASHFRDRVVHHAICNIIEPIFDKIFIYDSYANRKKKGSLAAINRFDQFQRKVSCNGRLVKNAKDNNMIISYVLKADIKHYFDTVDHEILINIIKKKIKDEKVLWLIKKILDNNTKPSNKGMPVGNMTSQFFANVYLNELDYFVKHKLRAKYYLRYVDDFVILHKSKETLLSYKKQINNFLKILKIELHEEKSQVYPLHKGIGLLGFRVFYYYKLLRRKNIKRMEKRLLEFKKLYENNEISYDKIMESIEGWYAYAMWGNTYKLRKELMDSFL